METRKIIPITIIGLGIGFLGYQIIKSSKPNVTYSNNNTNANVTLYGEPFNAKLIARKLKEAMLPEEYLEGTLEDDILELLTGITQPQFYQVIVAFGKPKYNSYFGSQKLAINSYPLPYWLKNELGANSDEYKTLKTLFPKYIK